MLSRHSDGMRMFHYSFNKQSGKRWHGTHLETGCAQPGKHYKCPLFDCDMLGSCHHQNQSTTEQ